MVLERDQVSIFHTVRDPVNEMAELVTERERQFTTARANQTTGLTHGRAANWAPEVAFSPFRALFPSSTDIPFLLLSLLREGHKIRSKRVGSA